MEGEGEERDAALLVLMTAWVIVAAVRNFAVGGQEVGVQGPGRKNLVLHLGVHFDLVVVIRTVRSSPVVSRRRFQESHNDTVVATVYWAKCCSQKSVVESCCYC